MRAIQLRGPRRDGAVVAERASRRRPDPGLGSDCRGPRLQSHAEPVFGATLPLPADVQFVFHWGGAEVRRRARGVARPLPHWPLPSLESRRLRPAVEKAARKGSHRLTQRGRRPQPKHNRRRCHISARAAGWEERRKELEVRSVRHCPYSNSYLLSSFFYSVFHPWLPLFVSRSSAVRRSVFRSVVGGGAGGRGEKCRL